MGRDDIVASAASGAARSRGSAPAGGACALVTPPAGGRCGRLPSPGGRRLRLAAASLLLSLATSGASAAGADVSFRVVEVDAGVGIGYGVALADMDGDGRLDIVLCDRSSVHWYHNPDWEKRVLVERLTTLDHVAIAVRDIDGDGRAEVAAGAGWNPRDTVGSGSVHYLEPPADRVARWRPVPLHHEPTVHRMRWLRAADAGFRLIVLPLHGRGNEAGRGEGVRILAYTPPSSPGADWTTTLVDDALHVTHNLDPVAWDDDPEEEFVVAAREGFFLFDRRADRWEKRRLGVNPDGEDGFVGGSEVRIGKLPSGARFLAVVEPFHGNRVVVYIEPSSDAGAGAGDAPWRRQLLDDSLSQGHAVACGDLLARGSDQVIVGWRGKDAEGRVGIRLYAPPTRPDGSWERLPVDDDGMACEDLRLGDVDGDSRLDVVAAGRATHNLRIYYNTPSAAR